MSGEPGAESLDPAAGRRQVPLVREGAGGLVRRPQLLQADVPGLHDLVPGVLFLPRHFADARASDLMVPGPGAESMTSVVKVRIERIEE